VDDKPILAELRSLADRVWAPDEAGGTGLATNPSIGTAASNATTELSGNRNPQALVAWVVQAGSFREEANAVAVRDRLRRSGYPSFVTQAEERTNLLFRVQVGPMIDQSQANLTRDKVMALLGRDAIVVSYP
jgi:cell division septation protein DedD